MSHSERHAVVTIANDAFIDYFIPFVESFREFNPDMRLIVIPFDSKYEAVQSLATLYQFEMYQGGFQKVDSLTEAVFGDEGYLKNRMRKLLAFDMDLDEFIYIDTDIIVQQSLDSFFGHFALGKTDLIYLVSAGKWVYKEEERSDKIDLTRSKRFASSCFLSSRKTATIDQIQEVLTREKKLFLRLRQESLFDQPLLNFFFDITRREVRQARDLGINAVFSDAFYDPTIRVSLDGKIIQWRNNRVTMLHWSGPDKFMAALPFADLLEHFARRARIKLASVSLLSGWTPFFMQH